jgi:peptidoglycan hydrolase CwlO-like protein
MAKTSTPSKEILEAAVQGLEAQRQKLDEQIAEVRGLMGQRSGRAPKAHASERGNNSAEGGRRKKRVLSAEARKRIAAAQKKRWAAFRKTHG